MKQIQFPWRLLILTMTTSSFLAAFILSKKQSLILAIFLLFLILRGNKNHLRTIESRRYLDSYYMSDKGLYFSSTDIAWESLPIWVKKMPKKFPSSKIQIKGSSSAIIDEKIGKIKWKYQIQLYEKSDVVLSTYYFRGWKVYVDNKETPIKPTYPNGLISFNISSGSHVIEVFLQSTTEQKISNMITLISIGLLAGVCFVFLRKNIYS